MKLLSSTKNKVMIGALALCALLILAGAGILFLPNVQIKGEEKVIFITEPLSLDEWLSKGENSDWITSVSRFRIAASVKRFNKMKPGRYIVRNGMSNQHLINMLRSGNQSPVRVRIDDVHTIYTLAGKLGKNLRADSAAFIAVFKDESKLSAYGVNAYTVPAIITPDTYDFLWTTTPEDFLDRMQKIHNRYWTPEKDAAASAKKMTRIEVAILASIVKAETAKKEEAPKIAGLYLNRLRIGMPLQSDPTAVFGKSDHDERVYSSDLQNDSPYNTYRFAGLPIGPIDFCETLFLDAVLNADQHEYIYMCAQPGSTGYHNFARTFEQHSVYAREYRQWLDQKGIR